MFEVVKILHIIFVISWFSFLFYAGRMMVYACESETPDLRNRFCDMGRRANRIIGIPSSVIVLITGLILLVWYLPTFGEHIWLHTKILLVILLFAYHHGFMLRVLKKISTGVKYSPVRIRYYSEIPTIFMVAIVSLVVMKMAVNYAIWGVVVLAISILLYVAIRFSASNK